MNFKYRPSFVISWWYADALWHTREAENGTFSCKEWCNIVFDIECVYLFVLLVTGGWVNVTSTYQRLYIPETPNKNGATWLSWRRCRQIKVYFQLFTFCRTWCIRLSVSLFGCLSVRLSANCNIDCFIWSLQATKFTCGVHILWSTHLQKNSIYTTC